MTSRQLTCLSRIAAESLDAVSSVMSAGSSLASSPAGKSIEMEAASEPCSDVLKNSRRFISGTYKNNKSVEK
jgi:hypothetical protein